jgi:Ca2+-binding RTX toxin-like protein
VANLGRGAAFQRATPERKEQVVRKGTQLFGTLLMVGLLWSSLALAATITGTEAGERLKGTKEADQIDALGGDDVVRGRGGDDTVTAGDGNDRVYGGRGADQLSGDAGDDRINGRGDGRTGDTISCGEGNDTVKAGRNDQVATDCETVKQPGAKGNGPNNTKAKGPKQKQP